MLVLLLAPLALAGELSLTGRVVGIHRDSLSSGYFIKMQGMSATLKSPPGEIYTCLRKSFNSEELLEFSFDPKTLKISSCLAKN